MTTLYNDPSEFAEDQLDGFVDLYSDRLVRVPGGVVTMPPKQPQVAVVVGGGSGHYPAFAGLVGPGLASGAVVGNIFTSPSAAHVYSVARAADQGRGVILTFGNYAGDNMNFGIAADMLRSEGIDARMVVVTDDVASDSEPSQRRGIAGDFTVFKAMGAAAVSGADIDAVEKMGRLANDRTRTLGIAFSGCTMPGADAPLFTVPEGQMGLGLGIHGEPGIRDLSRPDARSIADLLTETLLAEKPEGAGSRVAVILNGLGVTKYEELFLLYGAVAARLREASLEIVEPEVGELVTSLDMGGVSLTLMWLDDQLEQLWQADAYAAAYRKQKSPLESLQDHFDPVSAAQEDEDESETSEQAQRTAQPMREALTDIARLMEEQEAHLGEIDAVAGDGDHGRGMVRGTAAARDAVDAAADRIGPRRLLRLAGRAWAAEAGGTSGVLWGAALEAAGNTLDDTAESFDAEDLRRAVHAFSDALTSLGGAQVGDKTLVDALGPFVSCFDEACGNTASVREAWTAAAGEASRAAEATAELSPKKGRARPLAEKSVGHPDPGAVSLSMILELIAWHLA